MIDMDQSGTIEVAEFIGPLSRWAHDSKTAPRFIKYNMIQTMHLQEELYDLSVECFQQMAARIEDLTSQVHGMRHGLIAGAHAPGSPDEPRSDDGSGAVSRSSSAPSQAATEDLHECRAVAWLDQASTAPSNPTKASPFLPYPFSAFFAKEEHVWNPRFLKRHACPGFFIGVPQPGETSVTRQAGNAEGVPKC